MNLLHRAKVLTLSGVLVLGGLAVAAPAALAVTPQIQPKGGPGQVAVLDNGAFTPGASVRLEVLNPDLSKVLAKLDNVNINPCGRLSLSPSDCSPAVPRLDVSPYVGDVWVVADEWKSGNYLGTFWGHTQVSAFNSTLNATTGFSCKLRPVDVTGSDYQPGQRVLVRLFYIDASGLWQQLDFKDPPVNSDRSLPTVQLNPYWYTGMAYVTADPDFVGLPVTTTVEVC